MNHTFHDLAHDATSGATELIHRLLALCEAYVMGSRVDELRNGLAMLEHAQRSMPSFHAVLQILKTEFLPRIEREGENTAALGYLASLIKVLDESNATIATLFAEKLAFPRKIVTISRSGTVIAVLRMLAERKLLERITVLEARPLREGLKTIREFNKSGIDAVITVDAAMRQALDDADLVLVGADCISADGFLLNKIGTYPLALCSRDRDIPMHVVCDSLKFSPQLRADILIEDHPDGDIVRREKRDTFRVVNRYFEWMPIDLVTEFVTERGVFPPDRISSLAGE